MFLIRWLYTLECDRALKILQLRTPRSNRYQKIAVKPVLETSCINSTKQQNFHLVEIANICRWPIKGGLKKLKFAFGRVENIVGKWENAGYQHFLLLPMLSKGLLYRVIRSRDCVIQSWATSWFKRPLFWYNTPSWINQIEPAVKDHLL